MAFSNIFTFKNLVFVLAFQLSVIVMIIDPINLYSDTPWQALYMLPFVIFYITIHLRPTLIGSSNYSTDQKRELIYIQTLSIIRKLGAVLSAFILTGMASKVPLLEPINDVIVYIGKNYDISIKAIEVIIGLLGGITSQFSNNNRFEERINLSPRKIDLE
jgi:hypothetical protein